MTEITQADRDAAASGYFAWCSGNPVIPNRILGGDADDHSIVQAFARHRIAAYQPMTDAAKIAPNSKGSQMSEQREAVVRREVYRLVDDVYRLVDDEEDEIAAAVIRDYGDKRYQQAIADVVEWLTKERLSDTADHYAQLITRRFGKDA